MLELDRQKIQEILGKDFDYLKCINKQDPTIYVLNIFYGYYNGKKGVDKCLNYISDMGFDIIDQLEYNCTDYKDRKLYIFKEL